MHSSGFFNSKLVTEDAQLLADAASDIVIALAGRMDFCAIQRVAGPATGATKLAEAIHVAINNNGGKCLWASPEKVGEGPDKKMVFTDSEKFPQPGEAVLLCEDVLTTGGSVDLAASAVVSAGATVLPFVVVLVNRSGLDEVSGKKIISLINRPMPIWSPGKDTCELCAVGSEAIRPRQPAENWARLTGTY
jgi:orotate phosphoribosyltransferase